MPEAVAIEKDAPPPHPPAPGGPVARIDPTGDARWDADLAANPSATFFHGSAWARVLRDAHGFRPAYFTVRTPGRVHSLLALMEVDSWLTGKRGISLPFTDECPPLCAAPESFGRIYGEALEHARVRGWKYLELRGGREHFADRTPSTSFYGHRVDLRGGETAIFGRLESSVRRAVRKAGQSGLTIEFSQDLPGMRAFYSLLRTTRKRHGLPPQPFNFFAGIQRHVLARNQGWVILARQGRKPVAASVFLRFGRTAIYKYGASDEAFQHLRANNLVMWEAIRRHAAEGFDTLDLGRTSLGNEGLRRFKLGWGAAESRIDYLRLDCRTGRAAVVADASSGWHTRLFRRLPGRILQLIGTALYRHIA